MANPALPTVLTLLRDEPNVAADAALLEALPRLEPIVQQAVLDLLVHREQGPSLLALVARFATYDDRLQTQVAVRAGRLTASILKAADSQDADTRIGALMLICRAGRGELAYVLSAALRQSCSRTQEAAAEALYKLAARAQTHCDLRSKGGDCHSSVESKRKVVDALREGVNSWEVHYQPRLLEAAMWFIEDLADAFTSKMKDPRARLIPMLIGLIRGTTDAKLAPFVVWAHSVPTLREVAVASLRHRGGKAWSQAVVSTGGAEFQARLRNQLFQTSLRDRVWALSTIRELGLAPTFRTEILQLSRDSDASVRSLAVAALGELPGAASEEILRDAVDDPDDRVQANAIEALDQLDVPNRAGCTLEKLSSPHGRIRANAIKSLLRLDVRRAGSELLKMLADGSPSQRGSALWVVQRLELRSLMQRVFAISRMDPDERIRHRARRIIEGMSIQVGAAPNRKADMAALVPTFAGERPRG